MDGSENTVVPMDADSLTAAAASWTTADDFLFPASSASSCTTSPSSAAIAGAAARAGTYSLHLDATQLPHLSVHAAPPARLNSFNGIPATVAAAPGGAGIHHVQVPSLLTGFSRHRQLQFSRSVPSSPTFAHSRTPLFPNSNLLAAAARQFTANAQSVSTPATPAGSTSDLFLSTFQESPSDIASSLDLAGGGANSGLSPDPSIRSGSGFEALLDDANAGFSFDTHHMPDVPAPPASAPSQEPELLRLPSLKKRKSGAATSTPPAKLSKTEEKGAALENVGEPAVDGSGSGDSGKVKGQKAGEDNGAGDQGDADGAAKESKPPDPPKQDYIHVRARRGQATDSHSLAERVRREKISERMKFLQDLVPGCNKVTGKAVMLDEIINYVQSLQRQVEFLSMKLSAVSGNTPSSNLVLSNDQASQGLSHGAAAAAAVSALSLMTGSSLQQQLIQSQAAAAQNTIACMQAATSQLLQQHNVNPSATAAGGRSSPYLDHSTDQSAIAAQPAPADHQLQHHPSNSAQMNNTGDLMQHHHHQQQAAWEDELQSIVQMAGFS